MTRVSRKKYETFQNKQLSKSLKPLHQKILKIDDINYWQALAIFIWPEDNQHSLKICAFLIKNLFFEQSV